MGVFNLQFLHYMLVKPFHLLCLYLLSLFLYQSGGSLLSDNCKILQKKVREKMYVRHQYEMCQNVEGIYV